MTRLLEALQWLSAEFSADRHDFRSRFQRGADDLRDGLVARGFAFRDKRQDRYAVSPAGFRMLASKREEVADG